MRLNLAYFDATHVVVGERYGSQEAPRLTCVTKPEAPKYGHSSRPLDIYNL